MGQPKSVVRTEIPIIGDTTNFRDAIAALWDKMIAPNLNAIANAINLLEARVTELEMASKSINVFINPKEIQKIFQPSEKDTEAIEREIDKDEPPQA